VSSLFLKVFKKRLASLQKDILLGMSDQVKVRTDISTRKSSRILSSAYMLGIVLGASHIAPSLNSDKSPSKHCLL
jgi:hypothetical protein